MNSNNKQSMEPCWKDLPFEIIDEHILPRLPVKSLIRFTSVSKTWETLIKSPKFIATHFNFNKGKGKGKGEGRYPLILNATSCYTIKNQKPIYFSELIGSIYEYYGCEHTDGFPAASCNGLVLLKDLGSEEHQIEYRLWNPCIRKSETIDSCFRVKHSCCEFGHIVRGLGFRESTNDHRVVKIVYDSDLYYASKLYHDIFDEDISQYDKEDIAVNTIAHENARIISTSVKVYSLKTGLWRKVDSETNGLIAFSGGGVFLNGCTHWLATRKFDDNFYDNSSYGFFTLRGPPESILSFDFQNECFGEIKLPNDVDYGGVGLLAFIDYQGLLASLYFDYDNENCFLWVMDEYGVTNSWNNKLTIKLPKNCGYPFGFTRDGTIVIEEYIHDKSLISLRSRKKHTGSFKTHRKKVPGFIFLDTLKFKEPHIMVIDYMESLALLDQKSK